MAAFEIMITVIMVILELGQDYQKKLKYIGEFDEKHDNYTHSLYLAT